MNNIIAEVEEKTAEVKRKLTSDNSCKRQMILLYEYYQFLLNLNNKQISEAYIPVFARDYADHLKYFDPFCIKPSITKSLIEQVEVIKDFIPDLGLTESLINTNEKLKKELIKLNKILSGEFPKDALVNKLCFPLLEENNDKTHKVSAGILETVTIKISKAKSENKFLVIPSEIKIEAQLKKQIETSWQQAVFIVKRYVKKTAQHHYVIIHFDKRAGFYRGNSLGVSLTIAFIEELLSYYNSPTIVKIGEGIALTGGIDKNGNLIEISEEVIKKKVEHIFFSPVQTFIVPEPDKNYSEDKLEELKKNYPERKLNIIGIKTLDDLLDSRKLVDIRKQKIIVRSSKFAKKNWAAMILLVALTSLIYLGRFYDFDSNPAILVNKGTWLHMQNKNGKELWKKKMGYDISKENFSSIKNITQIIVDIDGDSINEVILARENRVEDQPLKPMGRVTCFSNTGEVIWENYFRDRIESIEMIHSNEYVSMIIDTVTINETKALVCFANNVLYPAAVYFLEIKTGKRIGSTLWNTGHLHSGKIGDFNGDSKRELVMFGLNNAYKRVIVFSIDIDKIGGKLPSTGLREFVGLKNANVNEYVLIPNTDYNLKLTGKYNNTMLGKFWINEEEKQLNNFLAEGKGPDYKGIFIEFDGNLNVTKIDPSLEFEIARDSLVSAGELSHPFTHTEEYQQILYNQIESWDGEKFVKRERIN